MAKAKVWTLKKQFEGFPKESDFELKEEILPELSDGEVLLEAVYLSLDPYLRLMSQTMLKEGDVVIGGQLAKVVQSKLAAFPVGCYVITSCGWRTHTVSNGKGVFLEDMTRISPDWPTNVPLSMALGALGMPGLTALYGLEEVLGLRPGEVVLVSAAAGAVGSVAGQICKIKGCKVVGSAGTDEKVAYLKELGFDHVFNYKTVTSLDEALREGSPEGYDCYFENVGGPMFTAALNQMRYGGRIAVCGAISTYNATTPQMCPLPHLLLLSKCIKMQGFQANQWPEKDEASVNRLVTWMKEGKLKAKENVIKGFEKLPAAFMQMLKGAGLGKYVV